MKKKQNNRMVAGCVGYYESPLSYRQPYEEKIALTLLSDFISLRTATKKITSLFFILLGFTPLLFVVLFTAQQKSIRHRMKERMEEQMLHTITLADKEIIWVKKDKEILVQGKMFDIKSVEHKKGVTIFHGLYDDEETLLNKNFTKGWEKNQSAQNQLLAQLFQCLQSIYFNPAAAPLISDKQSPGFFATADKLQSHYKTILTPPPQI